MGFILFSTLVTWGIALAVEKAEAGGSHKSARNFLVLGLILNFGMLGVIKYTNFMIENLNALFHMNLRGMEILLPLGISFYTFQSSGYLLDVYWKRCDAERNPVKYALFVSFFPQILQGPIGRYSRLAHQLYEPHKFEGKNITRGFERILWGFFKKMILADWAAVFVDAIFDNPDQYSGLAIFGVLFYTVQLYADFSGGMDVVIGIASMFGIELDENFKRPFFSISITDFWHRWHITLGTWMKDYVFYPVTLSKWMGKFGKWGKKVFGKKTGRTLPICLANLIVFFVVGVWHGAAWKYIVYGMYNGIIIAFSGLMAEHYRNWKKKFNITGKENWYHVFMIIRTFILVNIGMLIFRSKDIKTAITMLGSVFQPWHGKSNFWQLAFNRGGLFKLDFLLIAFSVILLYFIGKKQENGHSIRELILAQPLPIRWAIYIIPIVLIIIAGAYGPGWGVADFIYAKF